MLLFQGGIQVVAGLNIATSMYNIFTVVYQSVGGTVAIMMGQLIGAGKLQEAKEANKKLFSIAVRLSVICGIALFAAAPFIPRLYATTPGSKRPCGTAYAHFGIVPADLLFYSCCLFYNTCRRKDDCHVFV